MGRFNFNMDLLPMKGHYFLWNSGLAPVVPFLPIFARQLGLSGIAVGSIYAFLPMCGLLAKPMVGILADRYRIQKRLFLAFQIIAALALFNIQFIPEIPTKAEVIMDCHSPTYLKTCDPQVVGKCTMDRLNTGLSYANYSRCMLQCETTPPLLEEVCSGWHASQHCSVNKDGNSQSNNSSPLLEFETEIATDHITQVENCLYLLVKTVILSEDGSRHRPLCANLTSTICLMECDHSSLNEVIVRTNLDDSTAPMHYQFWLLFVFLVFGTVGMASVISVADAICFNLLGTDPSRYGQQRLWGAIGWGLFSVITGVLIDEFSRGDKEKNYTPIFYVMLGMLMLDMLVSSQLRNSQASMSINIMKDVGKVLGEARVIVFMCWCAFIGLSTGLLWQFLFWHLEDVAVSHGCHSPWIKTLEGLVMGVRCFLGELPFFFFSGEIIRRIGHVHAMSLVLGGFGVRFLLYGFLTDPWWCLPIELLQGITFGIFYTTMTSYASFLAPPGTEATMQGIVGAVFEGLGAALGSLLGGILYDNYGGAHSFKVFGIAALVMCVLHILLQIFLSRRPQMETVNKYGVGGHYASPRDAFDMVDANNPNL